MERVEKVARAMCEAAGFDPDTEIMIQWDGYQPQWKNFEFKAKQFIAAYDVLHEKGIRHVKLA